MKEGLLSRIILALRRGSFEARAHLHSYCLGLDIVGYSKHTTDVQCQMVRHIQEVVKQSPALKNADREDLVFLPTGDGMIVCLLVTEQTPLLIVELAEYLQSALKKRNESCG